MRRARLVLAVCAAAVGVRPDRMTYSTVAELPHASDKAIRDAGTIAITELPL